MRWLYLLEAFLGLALGALLWWLRRTPWEIVEASPKWYIFLFGAGVISGLLTMMALILGAKSLFKKQFRPLMHLLLLALGSFLICITCYNIFVAAVTTGVGPD